MEFIKGDKKVLFKVEVKFVNREKEEFDDIAQIQEKIDSILLYSEECIYNTISKSMITLMKSNILYIDTKVMNVNEEDKKIYIEKNKEIEEQKKKFTEFQESYLNHFDKFKDNKNMII